DNYNSETHTMNKPTMRVSTGLTELDGILQGGLPQNSITLISGTPGSGKTILCYHYIDAGVKHGEKCLFLTSDERVENILSQAKELGFDFQSAINTGQLKFLYLDLDRGNIHREIEDEIRHGTYTRIVLDSLTPVAEAPVWVTGTGAEIIPSLDRSTPTTTYPLDSVPATRVHVRRMMSILSMKPGTAIVTSEIPEGSRCLSRDSISEFLADGIILLDLDTTMDRRKITIRKMRRTKHTLKPFNIAITEGGIKFV
ncbi:MAG: ATPase domain-containing protein, partial [Methanobacteriota archaeon]